MDIDFVIDGGAYMTLTPVVLSRGAIHAAGPYECDNVRIRARAVATNTPPHGAFRGFGAPQSLFAAERQMDKAAKACGLTPDEFRRRNFLTTGAQTATSQTLDMTVGLDKLMDRAFAESDYLRKRADYDHHNADPKHTTKKGIGFASFYHGAGFTGGGEVYLKSVADVDATADGRVRIYAASTEIGQGKDTVFSQIVADAIGVSYDRVEVVPPDTKTVPDSGPTVASRTTMVVGNLVGRAAVAMVKKLRDADLLGPDYSETQFVQACAAYHQQHGDLRGSAQYEAPPGISWDEKTYRGDAYGTYAWAVYVADITVDTVTYEVSVRDFVAVQEIGKVVHPILAAGQIEGGILQAIGYALYEKVVWRDGRVQNPQMTNYIIPTSADAPPIRVFFYEEPYAYGPSGAKGIGELPMDGPAPAILSALAHATGVEIDAIPALPEDLMIALTQGAANA